MVEWHAYNLFKFIKSYNTSTTQSELSIEFSKIGFPFIVIFDFLDDECHDTNPMCFHLL
jgi:hypothetical protein